VRQSFQIARTAVVLPQQRRWRDDFPQCGFDVGFHGLHARGGDLPDDDIAEAIQHEPRQTVRFAVHQPVERPVVQRIAQ
jgi:hypothetical protein